MKLKTELAVAEAGAFTVKWVAPAGFTVIPLCVPVIEPLTVSVAVKL